MANLTDPKEKPSAKIESWKTKEPLNSRRNPKEICRANFENSPGQSQTSPAEASALNHGLAGAVLVAGGVAGVVVSSGFLQPTSTKVLTNVTTSRLSSFFMRPMINALSKKKQ